MASNVFTEFVCRSLLLNVEAAAFEIACLRTTCRALHVGRALRHVLVTTLVVEILNTVFSFSTGQPVRLTGIAFVIMHEP